MSEIIEAQRIQIGALLKKFREDRGITTYQMEKKGVRHSQMLAVEKGETSYTVDTLFKYLVAADMLLFFQTKEGRSLEEAIEEMQGFYDSKKK